MIKRQYKEKNIGWKDWIIKELNNDGRILWGDYMMRRLYNKKI